MHRHWWTHDAVTASASSLLRTTYGNGGHVTTEVIGFPDAIDFVEAAFTGTTGSGCSRNIQLSSDLNPIALGAELEPILVKLIEVLTETGVEGSNIKQNLNVLEEVISWTDW